MNAKWIMALCCLSAILGMFLPFYEDKILAGLPLHMSFTGAAMFGAKGEVAASKMAVAKALAYLLWSIPFSAALMIFAIAVGPVTLPARKLVGLLWIIVVVVVPTVAVDVALVATRPFFPGLPDPLAWVGLGVGGWVIVLAGIVMIGAGSSRAAIAESAVDQAPGNDPPSHSDRS